MEPYREKIEDFMRRWRSRYEGNRLFRVLVVTAAPLLVLLLALRGLRTLRMMAVPVLIGAILVVGWLLLGPLLTIPRFTTEGPVVRNGVAAITVCGKKAGSAARSIMRGGMKGLDAAMEYVPEPRTGTWWPVRGEASDCVTWYHRPPDAPQRYNRQLR